MIEQTTPNRVYGLATAVVRAGGNALTITEDNKRGEWMSIASAVESGQAFTVEVKQELIALDLDTPELIEQGEEARRLCEESGLPTLVVASGRNRHLYVNAGPYWDVAGEHLRGMFPAAVFRQSIRPPLSPHRLGRETSLISPDTAEEALSVLGSPEETRKLTQRTQKLLRYGDTDNRYRDNRSAMTLAIASGFKWAGLSLRHFREAMFDPNNQGAEKVHDLLGNGGDVESFITRTWDRAYGATVSVAQVWTQLETVEAAVLAAEWKGRTGTTDRAVMIALLTIAWDVGSTAPAPGARQLTELAQLGSTRTTVKALNRLVTAGWVTKLSRGRNESDAYRLHPGAHDAKVTQLSTVPPLENCITSASSTHHPVFRRGSGLGTRAGDIWTYLDQHGPTGSVRIAEVLGCNRSTVTRALKSLSEYELAEKTPSGWVSLGSTEDLDRIAELLGVPKVVAKQMERHDTERAICHGGEYSGKCAELVYREGRPVADGAVSVWLDTPKVCGLPITQGESVCAYHNPAFAVSVTERNPFIMAA